MYTLHATTDFAKLHSRNPGFTGVKSQLSKAKARLAKLSNNGGKQPKKQSKKQSNNRATKRSKGAASAKAPATRAAAPPSPPEQARNPAVVPVSFSAAGEADPGTPPPPHPAVAAAAAAAAAATTTGGRSSDREDTPTPTRGGGGAGGGAGASANNADGVTTSTAGEGTSAGATSVSLAQQVHVVSQCCDQSARRGLVLDDVYCAVGIKWWRAWCHVTGFQRRAGLFDGITGDEDADATATAAQKNNIDAAGGSLGAIDNAALVDGGAPEARDDGEASDTSAPLHRLKQGLRLGDDLVLVPLEAWRALSDWYG